MIMSKIVLSLTLITIISITPAFAESVPIEVDGLLNIHHAISYTSSDISIEHVSADLESISLIFQVQTSESESEYDISVTIQRQIFDAKIGDQDYEFFIIADGDEITFEEEKDDGARTLSFSIPNDTEEFEIFGTILLDESFLLRLEEAEKQKALQEQEDREYFYEVLKPQMDEAAAKINAKIAAEKAEKAAEEEAAAEAARIAALMATCGNGTVYVDGECVNEGLIGPQPEPVDSGSLINSVFAAMGIGLAVMIIVWGIFRSRHKKSSVVELDDS